MECWLKAKMYLINNGDLISQIENFVHLTRKCRSFINLGANDYELKELKDVRDEIENAHWAYSKAVYFLGDEFSFPKTVDVANNALSIIKMVIKEKTPQILSKSSKKEKRQEKARLNRSYGRGKNK